MPTEDVVNHHLEAFSAGDADEAAKDYDDQSVLRQDCGADIRRSDEPEIAASATGCGHHHRVVVGIDGARALAEWPVLPTRYRRRRRPTSPSTASWTTTPGCGSASPPTTFSPGLGASPAPGPSPRPHPRPLATGCSASLAVSPPPASASTSTWPAGGLRVGGLGFVMSVAGIWNSIAWRADSGVADATQRPSGWIGSFSKFVADSIQLGSDMSARPERSHGYQHASRRRPFQLENRRLGWNLGSHGQPGLPSRVRRVSPLRPV